mgnify:CR=1 FL=1
MKRISLSSLAVLTLVLLVSAYSRTTQSSKTAGVTTQTIASQPTQPAKAKKVLVRELPKTLEGITLDNGVLRLDEATQIIAYSHQLEEKSRALEAASAAESRSAQQASADLETDQDELTRLTAAQTRLQTAFDATNTGSGGILLRLEALDRLSDTNATLWAAQVMLSLLFMCVEILPVLMKLLLNFSPPSAYDQLAALRDGTDIDVEALKLEARRAVERAEAELLVLAETERVDRQKEAVAARREARLAAKVRASMQPQPAEAPAANTADTGRQLWDTGPLRLARSAAGRTVRSVRRRPAERVRA